MKIEDIKEGKTYIGKRGNTRTVKSITHYDNGDPMILWFVKVTHASHYMWLRNFARWAISEQK